MAQTVTVVDDSPSEVQAALVLAVNELITQFELHTHNADGSEAGSYFTSPPRSDTATVTAGTAIVLTTGPITTRL